MVKKKDGFFICEECNMSFNEKEWAIKCENFCRANKACNIDIIKHARKD